MYNIFIVNKVTMQQTHGNNVVVVSKKDIGNKIPNCDGLITNDSNITLVVKTADCLPISIIDHNNNVISLVHAGWRGLENKIVISAINILLDKFKSDPTTLKVLVGPHICQKHYEVQKDVYSVFESIPNAIKNDNGKFYLSLFNVLKEELLSLGILSKNITVDLRCTFENKLLPSYRRGDRNKRIVTTLNIKSS